MVLLHATTRGEATTTPASSSMATSKFLPFDAHNHVQLGPSSVIFHDVNNNVSKNDVIVDQDDAKNNIVCLNDCLSGMAVMGTHPRDFPRLLQMEQDAQAAVASSLAAESSPSPFQVVPCLGVHPWFLHELDSGDWETIEAKHPFLAIHGDDGNDSDNHDVGSCSFVPKWVADLEELLLHHPRVPVGEIGLDGFHFDPITKELTTTMDRQMDAFRYQLQLATVYQRPVSVHCVRATGKLVDVLDEVFRFNKGRSHRLPPRIYFHAFGGKAATAIQLIQTLERKGKRKHNDSGHNNSSTLTTKCYFGFAPIVNFESQKTAGVIRALGLDRLVLETDHEDASRVSTSMKLGLKVISDALSVSEDELIWATNANVKDLYQLD